MERIADLVHALPPSGIPFDVADVSGGAVAVGWLNANGRPARLVLAPREPMETRLWEPSPGLTALIEGSHIGLADAGTRASGGYGFQPLSPPPPLHDEPLREGEFRSALDLGCGTGRDAVFLAMRGWQVTAVDRLPDALDRARSLAELHGVTLDLRALDAERDPLPDGPFDLVTAFRYLLPLDRMAGVLAPGGLLIAETFTDRERERTGKPRDPRLVLPAEASPLLPDGLSLLQYRVATYGGRELATLVARRTEPLTPSPSPPEGRGE